MCHSEEINHMGEAASFDYWPEIESWWIHGPVTSATICVPLYEGHPWEQLSWALEPPGTLETKSKLLFAGVSLGEQGRGGAIMWYG